MQQQPGMPLFVQVAELITTAIATGDLAVGQRAPSTNELASFHCINPATARRGLSLLVDEGILEKRRGIGMFVTEKAQEIIDEKRRHNFEDDYLIPLVTQANSLGISASDLVEMVTRTYNTKIARKGKGNFPIRVDAECELAVNLS